MHISSLGEVQKPRDAVLKLTEEPEECPEVGGIAKKGRLQKAVLENIGPNACMLEQQGMDLAEVSPPHYMFNS